MKIIDLLNKIANEEIDRNNKYQFSKDDYCTINDFFARYIIDEENLNLEIIEEKKIPEKLNISNFPKHNNSLKKTAIKLNEVIDYLKSKGEGKQWVI